MNNKIDNENSNNKNTRMSDEEFMKQLEKQVSDVKQIFSDYKKSKQKNNN